MTKREKNLLDYLQNELTTAHGFLKRSEGQLEKAYEGLSKSESDTKAISYYTDMISLYVSKLENYQFRMMWLQGQMNEIKNLNK